MKTVLAVGPTVYDILFKPVDRLPAANEAMPISSATISGGGCGHNTARVLHRLGTPVHLVTRLGTDAQGRTLRDELARDGLPMDGIRMDKEWPTTTAAVFVHSSGQRSFLYYPGATDGMRIGDVPRPLLEQADIVHVGGTCKLNAFDVPALFACAKSLGKTTTLDIDYDISGRWLERIQPMLPLVDFFLPSYDEAVCLTGTRSVEEQLKILAGKGAGTVIVKCGEEGCLALDNKGHLLSSPAFPTEVIDTTGAGDAFVGGFLAGLARGWKLKECLRCANAAGSLAVRTLGATEGVKNWEQVEELLKDRPPKRRSKATGGKTSPAQMVESDLNASRSSAPRSISAVTGNRVTVEKSVQRIAIQEWFRRADAGGYAVPAFNYSDIWDLMAIVQAAEETQAPVMIASNQRVVTEIGIEICGALGLAVVQKARVPVYHHLDHVLDPAICKAAVDNKYSSVMIDASMHPLEKNIQLVKDVVAYAHARNVSVEGEVGRILGTGMEGDFKGEDFLTRVEDAVRLVAETGVDALAIGIGTTHGFYKQPPQLRFDRLKEINEAVDTPLVLHGGTGIPRDNVRQAIRNGINKVNVGTIVHCTYMNNMRAELTARDKNPYTLDIVKAVIPRIKEVVKEWIITCMADGKAKPQA